MNSPVQKIKERLSIEEVVSSYIKLEKVGANFKARCPFHNEKTPSFFISPDRGSYYCFGCGVKGDIFTFVEEFEGLDFKGALKLLADRAGVPLENFNPKDQKIQSEKDKIYEVMEEATKFFENNLLNSLDVLKYLKDRGLEDKTIKDFRIGFVKPDWRELYSHLQKKGYSDIQMEKAGLVKKTEKGFYDRFRGRIMFPISDSSGRIIAFSGRIFEDDGKSAKYLNSPETPIFNKSSVLYGIDKAKHAIKKYDFSIVVEGQFDLILSHQAGYKNTVATSGTSLTQNDSIDGKNLNSFGMISRLSNNIIFVFDYDKAGFNASIRAAKIALDLDMNVKAIDIPEGMDPADLISKNGVEAWKESIKNAKYIIEFLFEKYIPKTKKGDSLTIRLEISKNIIPVLNHIKNPITRSHFLSILSHHSGINVEDIISIANKNLNEEVNVKVKEIKENNINLFRKDYIERRLLGIILWQKTLAKQIIDVQKTFVKFAEILKTDVAKLLEKTKDIAQDLIFEAEVFYGEDDKLEKDVSELLFNLEEEYLKEELFQKMQELHICEINKDNKKSVEILKEINEINKKVQDIKNSRLI